MDESICKAIQQISEAHSVIIVQAENPDGDSLSSSLALEQILGDLGKQIKMYCPVQIPRHLRFLNGWDRVEENLTGDFDLSIIVDTSSSLLLEKAFAGSNLALFKNKPCIVLDHHTNEIDLPFTTNSVLSSSAAATGELIYRVAKQADWPVNLLASEFIAVSIMFDTLGMTTESTTSTTVRIIADLIDSGVNLAKLDNARRELNKKSIELVRYKADLMKRIDYSLNDQLAEVVITWEEIERYSDQYNPSVLVLDEMRMTENVKIAIAYKTYPDGKVTAKIRCNFGHDFADKLAEHFGGGGHPYAAGFKIRGRALDEIRGQVKTFLLGVLS